MKIAVCISGQIRTGIKASENIIRFIGSLYPNCDFFIHTWNVNSYTTLSCTNIKKKDIFVSQSDLDKIKEIYKPIGMKVDDFYEIKDSISTHDTLRYLWYSFDQSIKLKKENEKNNNFKYDVVIKLRFDIIFPCDRTFATDYKVLSNVIDNYIYIENSNNSVSENMGFLDDVYFFGNSNNMDIMAEYYYYMDGLYDGYKLYQYLISRGIDYFKDNDKKHTRSYSYCIFRPEAEKYSVLIDYKKCDDSFMYYYAAYNDETFVAGRYVEELRDIYDVDKLNENEDVCYVEDLDKKEKTKSPSDYLKKIINDLNIKKLI